jgi:hypothetical protein
LADSKSNTKLGKLEVVPLVHLDVVRIAECVGRPRHHDLVMVVVVLANNLIESPTATATDRCAARVPMMYLA